MNSLLTGYKEFLKNTTSHNTALSYMGDLMKFVKTLDIRSPEELRQINKEKIDEYINIIKNEGMAYSSVSRTVASLKKFFNYCNERNLTNPVDFKIALPSGQRKLPGTLTEAEVVRLLETPDERSLKGMRDKAMLEVMYATGVRVSELVNIKVSDISLKNELLIIPDGSKHRVVPLGKAAVDATLKYIRDCRKQIATSQSSDVLFLNFYGQPLTRQGFWKIAKSYIRKAGISENVTAQTLRHSFALHLLKNGADADSVSEMLGFSDVSSTKIYIDIMNNKIKEVYKNAHPRA